MEMFIPYIFPASVWFDTIDHACLEVFLLPLLWQSPPRFPLVFLLLLLPFQSLPLHSPLIQSLSTRVPVLGSFSQIHACFAMVYVPMTLNLHLHTKQHLWHSNIRLDLIICIFQNSATPNQRISSAPQLPQTWRCSRVSGLSENYHQPQDSQHRNLKVILTFLSSHPTAAKFWHLFSWLL